MSTAPKTSRKCSHGHVNKTFFRASRRKWASTPELEPTAGSLLSDGRQGSKALLVTLRSQLAPASVPTLRLVSGFGVGW